MASFKVKESITLVNALFGIGGLLVIIASIVSITTFQNNRLQAELVVHTYEVKLCTQIIQKQVRRQEAACRGFVIVRDHAFKAEFDTASRILGSRMDTLQRLLSDNPVQTQNYQTLSRMITRKTAIMRRTLAIRSTEITDSFPDYVQESREWGDRLDGHMRMMNRIENGLLKERNSLYQASAQQVNGFELGSLSVALIIFFLGWALSKRQAEKLEQTNVNLQVAVEEATGELRGLLNERSEELLRKNRELEDARRFQMSLIPEMDLPSEVWEVKARVWPAEDVGGDYYDYTINPDADHLRLAFGDAAGHGLLAAMIVSNVHSYFHSFGWQDQAGALLNRISQGLANLKLRVAFMAMAVIDLRGRHISITSAGMPPFLLYRKATGEIENITIRSIFLGSPLRSEMAPIERELAYGDLLLAYSDGLMEARNELGEQYGVQRIQEFILRNVDRPAADITEALYADMLTFTDNRQQDDVSVLALRIRQS